MSGADHDYDIQLDDKYGHLALIDLDREAAEHEPWFNQTLTTVNDSVVRLGVIEGEFHWHKHDDTDGFFLVLEGRLLIDFEDRETVTLESRRREAHRRLSAAGGVVARRSA